MISIALYARVSSAQQAQRATIDSQVAALQERAAADGHRVSPEDLYLDDGFSGTTLMRPGLERLRDRVAEGAIDLIYVHSPDRLARRYAYQVLLLEEFAARGVRVVFLLGASGETAEETLLTQVQGMVAEYERARLMERYRRGKLHRARQGLVNPLSGAPYGYRYVARTATEPARYEVVLAEAEVVRGLFDALVHRQQSIAHLVRELNAAGVPTRRGAPRWDRSTVWGILRNPAYAGEAAYGKTESVPRGQMLRPIRSKTSTPRRARSASRARATELWISIPVPALVTSEVFAAAREQLERNKRLSARNARGHRYLLQGLVVCASCGYAYYGKAVSPAARKGRPCYAYYRCVGSDAYRFAGGRICHNPQMRVDPLDAHVWDAVRATLEDPARVLNEWVRRAESDRVQVERRAQRDAAAQVVTAQERSLTRLLDAYEAGALDLPELTTRSDRLKARLTHAREALEQAETQLAEIVTLRAVTGRLEDFATRVRGGLEQLSWEERRDLIRLLVARVEIDPEGATVVFRLPTSPTTGGPAPTNSSPAGSADASCHLRGRREDDALRYHPVVDVDVRLSASSTETGDHPFRVVKLDVHRRDRHDHPLQERVACWYVTNLPREEWTVAMISALYLLRWAIERIWRQAKSLSRMDQLSSKRPAVVFIFLVSSLLLWAIGNRIAQEIEYELGLGKVSHDRVHAWLVSTMADIASRLSQRADELDDYLRRRIGVLMREGRHPNPSQPRRVTVVVGVLEAEVKYLPQVA